MFLDATEVFDLIVECKMKEIPQTIPHGKKDNVYYVVQINESQRAYCVRHSFSDDCVAWSRPLTSKHFFQHKNGSMTRLYKTGNHYYEKVKVKAKQASRPSVVKCVPVEPNPTPVVLLEIQRCDSSLETDVCFKRRISWISKLPADFGSGKPPGIAVIEYMRVNM